MKICTETGTNMGKLKPVRCGCGGKAVAIGDIDNNIYFVKCDKCWISTDLFHSKAEAIKAWNRAMSGSTEKSSTIERTAKVIKHKYWLGVSLNVVGEQTIGYEWLCENCKKKVIGGDEYCSHCGCRLDWNEDIPMEYFESGGR